MSGRPKRRTRLTAVLLLLVMGGYSALAVLRQPDLTLAASSTPISKYDIAASSEHLDWPSYGQAAVGAEGFGVLSTHGQQKPTPTASTAKIMVVLAILRHKPLAPAQHSSPIITFTERDVEIYREFVAKHGSVAPVAAGEQISEYQALQAILLPSANNVADSMAIWAFGSIENYLTYANQLADSLDLEATHIADPSGYSPQTVSSAHDLIKLTLAAMKEPIFREIVNQSTAEIPVAGTIRNVNRILGRDGIIGVKTGNTDEAGGVFVGAAEHNVDGKTVTVITAIMGAPHLSRAMDDTLPLLASAKKEFVNSVIIPAGSVVGSYHVPWSEPVKLRTAKDVSLLRWRPAAVHTGASFESSSAPIAAGDTAGTVMVGSNGQVSSTAIVTDSAISAPDMWWRFAHVL